MLLRGKFAAKNPLYRESTVLLINNGKNGKNYNFYSSSQMLLAHLAILAFSFPMEQTKFERSEKQVAFMSKDGA